MRTQVHMCICIAGILKRRNKELDGLFTTDDGYEISAAGARKYLCEQQALGRRVLPMGKCDNFDYQTGCRGHEIPDEPADKLAGVRALQPEKGVTG